MCVYVYVYAYVCGSVYHWFYKVFGGLGAKNVQKTIGFINFLVVAGPKMFKNHWFYKFFGGFGAKNVQKPFVSSNFSLFLNQKCSKTIGFIKLLVV